MTYVKRMMVLLISIIIFVGCSGSNDDELEEGLEAELDDVSGIDIEAIEEEIGIEKGDDSEIPAAFPDDVPLPSDMTIGMTIDNELMVQVRVETEQSVEELTKMYEDYLNSDIFTGEIEEEIYQSDEDDEYESYMAIYNTERREGFSQL